MFIKISRYLQKEKAEKPTEVKSNSQISILLQTKLHCYINDKKLQRNLWAHIVKRDHQPTLSPAAKSHARTSQAY